MPDASTLLLFAAASLVLTATPGPDMLLIASRSFAQGKAAGFLTYAGIAAGSTLHALAAALGLSQLLIALPVAYEVIRWLGAAYLLFLAWKTLRAPDAPATPGAASAPIPARRVFLDGLFTNLLNPKVALFVLALFPQFVRPEAGSIVIQMLLLSAILNGVGLIANGALILASGHLAGLMSTFGRFGHLPRYLLASVFIALAGRLAFGGRN